MMLSTNNRRQVRNYIPVTVTTSIFNKVLNLTAEFLDSSLMCITQLNNDPALVTCQHFVVILKDHQLPLLVQALIPGRIILSIMIGRILHIHLHLLLRTKWV
ncbi:uncharacterized protein LOC128234158 [Mya arenaria]|uniref:uncharacterized protein LOC128234158 n=1 Tax=Mya arenaria TaxID=6604 RepID=UPI0022E2E45B|nr:uncharacterized protein LOC128234158 [Mya arenaria]